MGVLLGRRRNPLIPPEAGGGWLMGAVTAALAFVACLALATAIGASQAVQTWTKGLAAAASVRVSSLQPGADLRAETAVKLLINSDKVLGARILSSEEVGALLRPWFHRSVDLDALPAPRVIEVTIDPAAPPDPGTIQSMLDGAGVGAVYDGHDEWRARAGQAARAVRLAALGVLTAVLLAMLAAIVSAVRGAMGGQRHVIAALRMAGAEDGFVARIYQRRFLMLGGLGAAVGTLLAVLALFGLKGFSHLAGLEPGLFAAPRWWPLAALGVTAGAALAATLAARAAALSVLRKES